MSKFLDPTSKRKKRAWSPLLALGFVFAVCSMSHEALADGDELTTEDTSLSGRVSSAVTAIDGYLGCLNYNEQRVAYEIQNDLIETDNALNVIDNLFNASVQENLFSVYCTLGKHKKWINDTRTNNSCKDHAQVLNKLYISIANARGKTIPCGNK